MPTPSFDNVVIARVAGALYGYQLGKATMDSVLDAVAQNGLNPILNAVVTRDFGSSTSAAIADKLITNLGITTADQITEGKAIIVAALNAAGAPNWGATIANLVNNFANLTANAFYGTFATNFNNAVSAAVTLSQTTGSTDVNSFTPTSEFAGKTFTLTTGVDSGAAFTGGAGNDTFNASATATFNALDSLDGGLGNDTLNVTDNGAAVATAGRTVTGIETAVLSSSAGVVANTTAWTGLTKLTVSSAAAGAQTTTAAATTALTLTNSTAQTLNVVGSGGALVVSNDVGGDINVGQSAVANAITSAAITGGNTVLVQDRSGASAATGSTLKTVSTDGAATAATFTGDGITSLTVKNTTTPVTVTAAAGTRALDITVNTVATGTSNITDATATSVTLNSTGASNTVDLLAVAAATSVTLAGDKNLTITALNAAAATSLTVSGSGTETINGFGTTNKLATITVTGAGGLKSDVSGQTVLTSIDASGSTGANTLTIDATKAAFTGGTGNDSVTVAASPTVALNGGAGTDTLVLNVVAATFSNPSANTKITGFETLGLGALANGAYDATGFTGLTQGAVAANVSYTNVAAGTTLTMTASPTATTTYVLKDATGSSDVLALTATSAAGLTLGTVTAAGVETINFTNTDTNTTAHTNTLTLVATSAKAMTVTGNAGLTLTNTGNTALKTFDASAVTGSSSAITFTSAATSGSVSIKGGAGADVLTGGVTVDTISGGAGADQIASSTGLDILTGGAGNDTFTIVANVDGNVYPTITDGTKGDIIATADLGTEVFTATAVTLAGTAVFQDYLNVATDGVGNVNAIFTWFQFAGDTYVVQDRSAGADFVNGTDIVVKLTGLIDLSTATVGDAILTLG